MTLTPTERIDLAHPVDWRLWKVCGMRGTKPLYYEDFKRMPCDWPKCVCERASLAPFGDTNNG